MKEQSINPLRDEEDFLGSFSGTKEPREKIFTVIRAAITNESIMVIALEKLKAYLISKPDEIVKFHNALSLLRSDHLTHYEKKGLPVSSWNKIQDVISECVKLL